MSKTLNLAAQLGYQSLEGAKQANIPLAFATTFQEMARVPFKYTDAQTNLALATGSITAAKCLLLVVYEGQGSFSWNVSGQAPLVLGANGAPPPADPAFMMLYRYAPSASALYLTTTGAIVGELIAFE